MNISLKTVTDNYIKSGDAYKIHMLLMELMASLRDVNMALLSYPGGDSLGHQENIAKHRLLQDAIDGFIN